MSKAIHHGIIQDDAVYTTKALARIILEKEEYATEKSGMQRIRPVDTETINKHLRDLKCKAKQVGKTTYVVGKHFREAVEASASLEWIKDSDS